MGTEVWLSLAIVALIICSAFFSATETAFTSINRVKLKSIIQSNSKKAKKAKKALLVIENYDKLLTTILIGNNIVNIASASIATVLFGIIIASEETSVLVSTIVMTAVTLIFGEISPKTLAKEAPESFAMAVSTFMQLLMLILSPFTWLFTQWKKFLLLFFKPKVDRGMSEAELITLVDEATSDGGINEAEGELIRSAIEFNELLVKDIVTPRVDMVAANIKTNKDDLRTLFVENGFSRLPIYEEDIDHIIGILHEKDFYNNYFSEKFELSEYLSSVICVSLTTTISAVLKMLQKSKTHMAIVVDEYGGTVGLVTLEDIIEELVGEIWDEHDEITEDILQISDDEYQVDGACTVQNMFEYFDLKYDEAEFEVTTVGGWAVDMFGYIPSVNDQFDYKNLHINVIDSDSRRVDKISVKVFEKEDDEEDNNFLDKLFMKDDKKEDKKDDKRDDSET